ncbi:MAG TPA: phosphoglycerate kinase [Acidimicrobiia bacterium]|nr:phosphoglycerate kinase [Acidimicrobiia bacterium]
MIPTLDSVDLTGRTVLVRSDLNVPLADGVVGDSFRLSASLRTIDEVRASAKRVIVASHLGRPKGFDPSLSMAPVTAKLGELGGFETVQAPSVMGAEAARAVAEAPEGAVVVLENTRFEAGESKNAPDVADGLAALADVYVNDAFGTAHRAHASNVGVSERLPSVAGRLLQSEIEAFERLLEAPPRPYVVIMGGAKISDKLAVIENLLPSVDRMLIGGGMCFTLLRAAGHAIGDSLYEESMLADVTRLLESPYGDRIVLPSDIVIAESFAADAAHREVSVSDIPEGWMGLDIGSRTVDTFATAIRDARSVFWNGPMGVFEWEAFRAGTEGVADAVASCTGYTVVGGGDSVAALRLLGRDDDVAHVSSGGGAGLEMLEGKVLPGIAALTKDGHHA